MNKLLIKPMSANKSWFGRKHKTTEYRNYEKEVLSILPDNFVVPNGDLKLTLVFGYSNKLNDIDNGVKPFLDILQKKYGFNDSRVYELNVRKVIVKKGKEFIDWRIEGEKLLEKLNLEKTITKTIKIKIPKIEFSLN